MITKYNNYNNYKIDESVSFPHSLEYWLAKGKIGKQCIIYLHDDLDGIVSGIVMKEYLKNHGFTVAGYCVVNYTDSWKFVAIDRRYINVCVDFAEDNDNLDIYLDHHGSFNDDILPKSERSVKFKTGSAYEGICIQLGIKTDAMVLSVIDMIDSAKYREYDVDIRQTLNFEMKDFRNRLQFAAAFNQMIKRSDFRTIMEVVHNCNLSIYQIFLAFKILYPQNNPTKEGEKDFVDDAKWRLDKMTDKVIGTSKKVVFKSQRAFIKKYWDAGQGKIVNDGFQMFGSLAFFPSGTWANPIRARALLATYEIDSKWDIEYMLLQYGNSLQIVAYNPIPDDYEVKIPDGYMMSNLGHYTRHVLEKYFRNYMYNYQKTLCGGHKNIGNISNIFGICQKEGYKGIRYIDMMKNQIIADLSGIRWKINMPWGPVRESETKDIPMNYRLMMVDQIRNIW